MKLIITFKQESPQFDKEYAEQYRKGKESSGNWKSLWAEVLEI